MTDPVCHSARLTLTEYLLLGRPMPIWLSRHVAGCTGCAAQAEEVRDVVRTLRRADPRAALGSAYAAAPEGAVNRPAPLEDLGQHVVAQLQSARLARRRTLVGTAVAALVFGSAVLVPALVGGHKAASPVQGTGGVRLMRTGPMIPQLWGTEVPVTLSGMRPAQTYQLMTENAAGQLVQAGSVRATAGTDVHTNMMSAMSRDSIVALLVDDQHGHRLADISVTTSRPGQGAKTGH
jgi:hypothetical protein